MIVAALRRRLAAADGNTLCNFAWFAGRRGETQAALDAAQAALAMPAAPRAAWRALECLAVDQVDAMLLTADDVEPAARAPSESAEALLSRGRSLLQSANLSGALSVFDQVLTQHPANAAARFHRGVVLAKFRRYDEALDDWEAVDRAAPTTDLREASRRHARSARQLASLFAAR